MTGHEPSEWCGRPCEAVGDFAVCDDEAKVRNEQLMQSLGNDAGDTIDVDESQRALFEWGLRNESVNEARHSQRASYYPIDSPPQLRPDIGQACSNYQSLLPIFYCGAWLIKPASQNVDSQIVKVIQNEC